jgi:lipopolysaccharide export LptBFGC system permease protein LptF
MKSSFFLILSFFLYIQLITIINSKKHSKKNKTESIKENENEKEETNSKEKEKEKEAENHMMTEEEFEIKLQEILKEKRIRKNFKITKDKLKEIFEEIYEKDFALPDLPEGEKDLDTETKLDPKEESKRFLNEIFYKLARSLDYDDEILPNQIKEYISPKRVQEVVGEIVENLIDVMGHADL